VVLSTVFVVSILFSVFYDQTDRQESFSQMENRSRAVVAMTLDANTFKFDTARFKQARNILLDQNIDTTIYNKDGEEIYPNKIDKLSTKIKNAVKKRGTSYRETVSPDRKLLLTSFYRLVLKNGKSVGYLKVSTAQNSNNPFEHPLRGQLVFAGLIAGVISFIIALAMSRNFSSKITQLQTATQKVARRDYSIKVPENKVDEIGALGHDINVMTRSLKRQQKDILDQEERRKTFMANASHEMRTPLTVLSGFLEAFENDLIKEEDEPEYILKMHNEVNRLTRLVKDNLDFERLRSAKKSISIENFNASDNIRNVVDLLGARANEKEDKLKLIVPDGITLDADEDRLTQLAINLITNSIQFTKKGTITIELSQDDEYTKLRVSDTGIGMEQKDLDNIFERYYKADKSRTKTEGESGLGMAIVKEIVDLHKGKIDISSKPGKGTTTVISIPNNL
jgi:signal transduction histidine kinase